MKSQIGVQVLDHGFVRLVDVMGSDLSVVRAARVSYDAAWRAGEDEKGDEKLIRYLWKNQHTTPFEAVTMTFEIVAPIFVIRQWHRHRTQSYNELSARYRELPEKFYVPSPENVGVQSEKNKQGRDLEKESELLQYRGAEINHYIEECEIAFANYHHRIIMGWPRELARIGLPLSTYTHMFTTMNLLNLFRFLKLRLHEHAQFEIREYAKVMLELIKYDVPICCAAFEESLT